MKDIASIAIFILISLSVVLQLPSASSPLGLIALGLVYLLAVNVLVDGR